MRCLHQHVIVRLILTRPSSSAPLGGVKPLNKLAETNGICRNISSMRVPAVLQRASNRLWKIHQLPPQFEIFGIEQTAVRLVNQPQSAIRLHRVANRRLLLLLLLLVFYVDNGAITCAAFNSMIR